MFMTRHTALPMKLLCPNMLQVRWKEEAIEWIKRAPNPHEGESEIEIRQVFEAEDFGAEFTPELRKQEERIRSQVAGQAAGKKA